MTVTTKRSKPPVPAVGNAWEGHFDEILPYSTRGLKERLTLHPTNDPEFVDAFIASAGGGLREQDGGSWERMRKASFYLENIEPRAALLARQALVRRIDDLDYDDRKLVELYARVAGVRKTFNSPAVTSGEVVFFSRIADWIEIAEISDVVECLTTAFPGAEEISPSFATADADPSRVVSEEGTPEGGLTSTPSGESDSKPPKAKLHVDDGVNYPDDYFDAVDLSGNVADIKRRINHYLHAHLIAEVGGKNRSSMTDFLKSKLHRFSVPEEWRSETATEEETA